jgi:hypothetical protein
LSLFQPPVRLAPVCGLYFLALEFLGSVIPIDDVEPSGDVIGPAILILQIISVFPVWRLVNPVPLVVTEKTDPYSVALKLEPEPSSVP